MLHNKRFFYLFFLIGLSLLGLALQVYYSLNKPMFTSGEPIIVEVKPNSTANSLVNFLYNKKLIKSKLIFQRYIDFKGLADRLKAGTYEIKPNESPVELFNKIVAGKVLILAFRIPEGSTINQVKSKLKQAPYLTYNPEDFDIIKANFPSDEGLLLADTYFYEAGSNAKKILRQANKNLFNFLNLAWKNRASGLPYETPYEMLIIASILEKEASVFADRQIIAGILINRLKIKMRLQLDTTVIYAAGGRKLSKEDFQGKSPYNTYRQVGLPPTPIAIVGKESIEASSHPKSSEYLYFLAKDDGSQVFSKTFEEHRKAIARYLTKEN